MWLHRVKRLDYLIWGLSVERFVFLIVPPRRVFVFR